MCIVGSVLGAFEPCWICGCILMLEMRWLAYMLLWLLRLLDMLRRLCCSVLLGLWLMLWLRLRLRL